MNFVDHLLDYLTFYEKEPELCEQNLLILSGGSNCNCEKCEKCEKCGNCKCNCEKCAECEKCNCS
mgnify:CR=1 FL=1